MVREPFARRQPERTPPDVRTWHPGAVSVPPTNGPDDRDGNPPYWETYQPPQPPPGYGYQPGWGYPPPDPAAPYGRDPLTGQPLSDKSKVAAGLLQIFLGPFGAGRFYTGHTNLAVTQLSLTILGFITAFIVVGIFVLIGVQIWVLIDGIILLSGHERDARGYLLRS